MTPQVNFSHMQVIFTMSRQELERLSIVKLSTLLKSVIRPMSYDFEEVHIPTKGDIQIKFNILSTEYILDKVSAIQKGIEDCLEVMEGR